MAKRTSRKTTSAVLGLYVHPDASDRDYYHLRAYPVWIGGTPDDLAAIDRGEPLSRPLRDQICNVSDYHRQQLGGLDLHQLMVNSQGDNGSSERHLYGWEVEYRDLFSIDLRKAQQMAKTLATIEKRIDALNEKYGRPGTFGTYLLRVADAIGATRIVWPQGVERSSYSEREHRIMSLYNGSSYVDGQVREWVKGGQLASEEAAS